MHKSTNILDALPSPSSLSLRTMLAEIETPRTVNTLSDAAKAFDNEFRAKWPKAADKIRDDLGELLCFFDFPAEHWVT